MNDLPMKTLRIAPLALTAVLALSGCSLIPTYERPAAPVASQYQGADAQQSAAATPAAETSWQYFFKDARLKRLIAVSLENNRDLRVAVLTIEQARAQLQVRQADQLPTVNAGITGTRGPATTGTITSTYTAGLSVTAYELDFFGRVRALSQAAQAQLLGTEEARKTVQISLIAAVANTYLSLLADDALLRVTGDTLASEMVRSQIRDAILRRRESTIVEDWMRWNLDRVGFTPARAADTFAADEADDGEGDEPAGD